jgi:general secretion pathway protein D
MKNNQMTPLILTTIKRNRLENFLQKATAHLTFGLAIAAVTVASVSISISQTALAEEPSPKLNQANLSFASADIESVIKAIGHYTGTTFIIDPRVKGTINLVTEKPVTKEQAFSLLTSTLRLQGYAVVTANGFTKVLPESDGKLQAGPTQAVGIKGDQIATQVYRLNYANAATLQTVLRPLISPYNTISIDQANNSIVVTDYADNLKRLGKIIATMDVPGAAEADVIPLKHAIANDIAALIVRLTEQQPMGPFDSGKITILADSRSNTILLKAPSEERANLVKKLIEKLDQPTAMPGNVHVVYLRNADAMKLAQTLRAISAPDSSSGTNTSSGSNSGYGSSQGFGSQSRSSAGGFGGSGGGFGGSGGPGGSSGFGGGMGGGMGGGSSSSSSNAQATLSAGGAAGFIQADAATNTLIITASEAVYRNLRAVIDQLDARRAQVYIEALIIDVQASDLEQFGIQWAGLTGNDNSKVRVGGASSFNTAGEEFNLFKLAAAKGKPIPSAGLNVALLSSQLGLGAIASALQRTGIANVLSVPTLTTLDNEEANVLVGQNIPIPTGQYTNTAPAGNSGAISPFQTIERKDVGVILKVRPQISEGGAVKMTIYQEVSDADTSTTATSNSGYVINKRSIDTTVIVDDGELLVLGGLMNDNVNGKNDQVPILGNIPIIGNLFKYRQKERKKRNLLVFLRPTVLRNMDQSNSVSVNRYDYMRAAARAEEDSPLLNVPPLAPEKGGMLIPQTILNRELRINKLDSQGPFKTELLPTDGLSAPTVPRESSDSVPNELVP